MKKIIIVIFPLLAIILVASWFYNSSSDSIVEVEPAPILLEDISPAPSPIIPLEPIISSSSEPIIASVTPTIILASSTKNIKFQVPFTSQAPLGEWSDPRQQNGCEEASALMAVYWATGQSISPQAAKEMIIAISDWEQEKYGGFQDTSVNDTVSRIFVGYFDYQEARAMSDIILADIIAELEKGNLVIVPADGRALQNKFFQSPGPEEHMLVIIGYDYQTKEFITNDPGTKHGQDYRYNQQVLFNAIRNYPTGNHLPIIGTPKAMIVVSR